MKKVFFFIVFISYLLTGNGQTWNWAKQSLGFGLDEGISVFTDPLGNAFVTGAFGSPQVSFGTYTLTNATNDSLITDFFLTKYDPNGNELWAKSAGGVGYDSGLSVTTDLSGNVFVCGSFSSPSIVFGTYTLTNSGGQGIFIVKFDTNGNVIWARQCNGIYNNSANSICSNSAGEIFIAGSFNSPTLTLGTYSLNCSSGISSDVFLAKYDNNGNIQWAKSGKGSGIDAAYSVNADGFGNVFITGMGASTVFGAYTLSVNGSFLVKYDNSGNVLWVKGSAGGTGTSVGTNTLGNVFVAGNFQAPNIVFGTYTLTSTSGNSSFLTNYDSNGNVIWAKGTDGGVYERAYSLSTNGGDVFVIGYFGSLNLTLGSYTVTSTCSFPLFIAQYDFSGNVIYAGVLNSNVGDDQTGVAIDNFCNVYIGGDFIGSPFIVGTSTLNLNGSENIFISKLNFNCQPLNINSLSTENNPIRIFPNPSNGVFDLEILNNEFRVENTELRIVNVLGQEIKREKLLSKKQRIDLESLSSGIYYLQLINQEKILVTKKVLKE